MSNTLRARKQLRGTNSQESAKVAAAPSKLKKHIFCPTDWEAGGISSCSMIQTKNASTFPRIWSVKNHTVLNLPAVPQPSWLQCNGRPEPMIQTSKK